MQAIVIGSFTAVGSQVGVRERDPIATFDVVLRCWSKGFLANSKSTGQECLPCSPCESGTLCKRTAWHVNAARFSLFTLGSRPPPHCLATFTYRVPVCVGLHRSAVAACPQICCFSSLFYTWFTFSWCFRLLLYNQMEMAGSNLAAYQAENKPVPSQAPDDLSFLTQIWMNHSNNSDRGLNGSFGGTPVNLPHASSVPSSPAAPSSTLLPQNTLSASDAILNAGQLRKEPPTRAAGLQSQSGDALLQAFSELPQQQSLKVNTAAQLAASTGARTSQDPQRAPSPFWLRPPSQASVTPQVLLICCCLEACLLASSDPREAFPWHCK